MPPLLSVIITVHNKAPFIQRCTRSVLAQSFHDRTCCDRSHKDIELILVDDGSTDNSGKLCDALAAEHTGGMCMRVIHQENKGVVAARAAGTEAARGEFIHHVDADDWLEPDMESVLMDALEQTGADIALTGYIDERAGKRRPVGTIPPGVYGREAMERDVYPYMITSHGEGAMGLCSSLWTGVMRKSLIAPILSSTDPQLRRGEDALCLYQAVYAAHKIVLLEGSYYHYCVNPRGVTARPLPDPFSNLERLMRAYMDSPMAENPLIRRQFPNKFWYHVLHGDQLARRFGIQYTSREWEDRARIVARIEALESECSRPA